MAEVRVWRPDPAARKVGSLRPEHGDALAGPHLVRTVLRSTPGTSPCLHCPPPTDFGGLLSSAPIVSPSSAGHAQARPGHGARAAREHGDAVAAEGSRISCGRSRSTSSDRPTLTCRSRQRAVTGRSVSLVSTRYDRD